MEIKLCIICKGENPITEDNPLTDEHIIPEFIGGSLVKKNVCKKCNSTMGAEFEGSLANSLFYKLPRFIYGIKGKKSTPENPFVGVYEHEEIGRFRLNENGDLTVIPDVSIKQLENGIEIRMSIDKSDLENAKPLLEKKLSRHLKSQGLEIDKEKFSKAVDKLLDKAEQSHNKVHGPLITGQIKIDIHDQNMLYCKIAYELAAFHFGSTYLDDPVADKIRIMLKTQKPNNTLRGQFPAEGPEYRNFFDDENHWVMFINSACFIQLFGFPGVVVYTEENSPFQVSEGVVYKFCYKTQKHEVIPLAEHLASLTRPSI